MATVSTGLAFRPMFMQAGPDDPPIYYTAQDFRTFLHAFATRDGVLTPTSFKLLPSQPQGWRIDVNGGYAKVGTYLVYMPERITVPLTGFNTNPTSTRTHRAFIAVYDALYTGTEYTSKVIITEDTGQGAPTPTGTAAILAIGTFTISGSDTSIGAGQIDPLRVFGGPGTDRILLDGYLAANYASARAETGSSQLRCWYQNNEVRFAGSVKRTNEAPFAGGSEHVVFTVPEDFRPKWTKYLVGNTSVSPYTFRARFGTNGLVTCYLPAGSAPTFLSFDGMTYDLD